MDYEVLKMTEPTSKVQGLIYNIQRYSLHDGPGIRTIIFLKGCPLRCKWCSNPESQKMEIETMKSKEIGRIATVGEILDIASRDKVFYEGSNGGITLSGGEALMQPDFAQALVCEAKKRNIHVAIETTAFQRWNVLWKVIEKVDLILLDIKVMDSKLHKQFVGVSNELIIQNARKMAKMNKNIIVRIPIIPGHNDDWNNLANTSKFCKNVGIKKIEFLPYHPLGEGKYEKLNRKYELKGLKPPSKERLRDIALKLQKEFGVDVLVV